MAISISTDTRALGPADLRDPDVLLATGFGSGFLPKAPGTWGALLGAGLWWWLSLLAWPWQLALILGLFLLGCWRVDRLGQRYGVGDAGCIVVDEVVGVWLTLLLAPRHWLVFLLGFALFRLFDIAKPGPVRWAERRFPGGVGVMIDDVVAGLLAMAVLHLSLWLGGALLPALSE